MKTVIETKKTGTFNQRLIIATCSLVIYFDFTSPYSNTKYFVGITFAVYLIWFIIKKNTLKFTIVNENISIVKNIGLFYKTQNTEFTISEISRIKIWTRPTRSDNRYLIEFLLKDKTEVVMPFIEIDKRAEIISILKSEILINRIKLIYSTSIYDNASIDLNEIILNNFNLIPNKFDPNIYFNGKNFE